MTDKLTVLGTGDSESLDYWNAGFLLETDDENRLLIDCGHTIKHALRDVMSMSLPDIDAIYITHVHGDHVFGLERVGFESRYVYNKRVRLYLEPELYTPLWEQCLKGCMGTSSNGANTLEDFFDVVMVDDRRFVYGDVHMQSFETSHTAGKPCFGLVFNDRLIYTADTNPLDWLAADDSERTIIHDCSLADRHPAHATLPEMQEKYPDSVLRRVHAIHYGDEMERYRQRLEEALGGIVMQGQVFDV